MFFFFGKLGISDFGGTQRQQKDLTASISFSASMIKLQKSA